MRPTISRFVLVVFGLALGATLVIARSARAADPAGDAQAGKATARRLRRSTPSR